MGGQVYSYHMATSTLGELKKWGSKIALAARLALFTAVQPICYHGLVNDEPRVLAFRVDGAIKMLPVGNARVAMLNQNEEELWEASVGALREFRLERLSSGPNAGHVILHLLLGESDKVPFLVEERGVFN